MVASDRRGSNLVFFCKALQLALSPRAILSGHFERDISLRRFKQFLAAATLTLVASCGSSAGGGGIPADIAVLFPPTNASVSLDFDFSATGTGTGLIGNIDIAGSQGTIVIDNQTLNTIVYAKVPWESSGYNLYQGIAFTDADFFVYWLYCSISDNSLNKIYYESTDRYALTLEWASGNCNPRDGTSQPSFALTERNIGISRLVTGYTITGNDVSLSSGQPGTLTYTFSGITFVLYPFEAVDCSGCSEGPWWELHSITSYAAGPKVCFTVLYLFPDSTDNVFSSYSICFPDLDNINASLAGTWMTPD